MGINMRANGWMGILNETVSYKIMVKVKQVSLKKEFLKVLDQLGT